MCRAHGFFQHEQLAQREAFSAIPDPTAWQREQVVDRVEGGDDLIQVGKGVGHQARPDANAD